MHHDKLPKVVAHNYLEILADDTNELLESFDADFRVSLGEGLNFAATFLRGPYAGAVSPAQRLSEGQKVLLALAFRVAVNSLFAGTAGLLCLDEPTESLDREEPGMSGGGDRQDARSFREPRPPMPARHARTVLRSTLRRCPEAGRMTTHCSNPRGVCMSLPGVLEDQVLKMHTAKDGLVWYVDGGRGAINTRAPTRKLSRR